MRTALLASHERATPLRPAVIEAFRRRDREAFFIVYEIHATDLRALAARFFPAPFEREEAVQEIWLNVHEAAPRFDPDRGALRPWLRALATNRCLQLLRARGRRPAATEALDEDALAVPDAAHAAMRDARARAAIEAFAAGLPPGEREILRLAFAEEGTQDEVAARLGISVRRYKYLKKKLLAKAGRSPELASVLDEVLE